MYHSCFRIGSKTRVRAMLAVLFFAIASPAFAAVPVGIVDNPCPPPLVKPAGVLRGVDLLLTPGAMGRSAFPPPDGPAEEAYWAAMESRQIQDWPGLCRYPAENLSDRARGPVSIVFMGDSITEFWKPASPAFFGPGVLDRGISGQVSGQMLLRFQADVVALQPKVVHILAGTNDAAGNTGPQRPVDVENNLRAMVELAGVHHIRVVLGTIPPADHFFWQQGLDPRVRIAEVNAWIRAYAKEKRLGLVDYYAALATADGALAAELSNDGVHPNQAGYAVMEKLARPVLDSALHR
ncbi:MAG: GDSL-type esterase/lipase family protein [Pseudomonadota bacterium]